MCGLAGAITAAPLSQSTIVNTAKSMCHRGPDGSSIYNEKLNSGMHLTFLFSRLSVIDTREVAMQPIETEKSVFILNGEIYNYMDLKKNLNFIGSFKSKGDVEVAALHLDNYGIHAVKELDGMFAFARLDKNKQILSLSRDFFGEKPLYYLQSATGLFFASEIPTLQQMLNKKLTFNETKISMYLGFGYKHLNWDDKSFFKDVQKVSAGHILTFNSTGKKISDISFENKITKEAPYEGNYEEAIRQTRSMMIKTVETRLISDVPIALSLSGGIDSSVLAAIIKKVLGFEIPTYFLRSKDPRYDESRQVVEISKHLGLHTNFIDTLEDSYRKLEELTRKRSTPVITSTFLAHAEVLEHMSRDGIKVSLMGTAADEIFSGYYDHHLAYFKEIASSGQGTLDEAVSNWRHKVLPFVKNPELKRFNYYLADEPRNHNYFSMDDLREFLFLGEEANLDLKSVNYVPKYLRNRMLNELFHETTPVILSEDDSNAMFHSIENRSPYLRKELFWLLLTMPTEFLIRKGNAKSILRDAFSDLLPSSILYENKKTGFNVGVWELFPGLKNKKFLMNFISSNSQIWDFVRKENFIKLISKAEEDNRFEKLIFAILSTKVFLDTHQ